MSNHQSEWATSSGLPLADAEVTITGFEFGYNNDITPGAVFANIEFLDADGETHEQSFSVGKGWEITNKGAALVSETGKPKKFASGSNFGRLVDSAVASLGSLEKAEEVLGAGPKVAASWLGTKWHTTTVEVEVSKGEGGEKVKRDRIIFDDYLGREGEAAPAKGKAKDSKSDTLGIDADLFNKLVTLAKESDDHDAFMDAALELDGVQGVKEVEKLVMGTKAGASIWSAAGK